MLEVFLSKANRELADSLLGILHLVFYLDPADDQLLDLLPQGLLQQTEVLQVQVSHLDLAPRGHKFLIFESKQSFHMAQLSLHLVCDHPQLILRISL